MDTERDANLSLKTIPANRHLIEMLASHRKISAEAREFGLQRIHPAQNWGLWVSRLLLVLSVSLILSGIVYFFAFNWTKITPAMKLGSIQFAILGCLGASYYYGLQRQSGKILLLSACVLVGVFLAVFGQIYQTGADAYNLFVMWALLILPWVLIAEFAALWAVWLVVSNIFLVLYWDQAVLPAREMQDMIVSYLAMFNGLFLGLREYFYRKGTLWLEDQWTRVVLVIPILICVFIPTFEFILDNNPSKTVLIGTMLSVIVHLTFYIAYRYKMPDMWAVAATMLSGCIIAESVIIKILTESFRHADAFVFLMMGGSTLVVFTLAIVKLRSIAKTMEENNV